MQMPFLDLKRQGLVTAFARRLPGSVNGPGHDLEVGTA
jgi:hypothetical protein